MKLDLTRYAFLKSLTLALLLCCCSTEASGQYVRHLRGPLERPADIKPGDKIPVGQVISTGSRGRVILEYQNLPSVDGRPGYGFVIINRNETYTVPEKIVSYSSEGYLRPRGSSADLQKTTGIGIVILYGSPGASGAGGRFKGEKMDNGRALEAFTNVLDQIPDTLDGTISSVARNSFKVQRGGESYDFQITPNTKIVGASRADELLNKGVWVEYLTKPNFAYSSDLKTRVPPYFVQEVVSLMPTRSPDFYRYLGFEERESYGGSCTNRPPGYVCVDFGDGYVWLVQDSIKNWGETDSRYDLQIRKALGNKAEYHHIMGTVFIMKADTTQRD